MTIQIIIMTHGRAGKELIESSKMIMGDHIRVPCLSLLPGMSIESLMNQAKEFMKDGKETLFLLDLYGGTPSNVAMTLSGIYKAKCVSGLNLGMLMETLMAVERNPNIDLDELQQIAFNSGKESCKEYHYIK